MKSFIIIFISLLLIGCNNNEGNLTIYNNETNNNKPITSNTLSNSNIDNKIKLNNNKKDNIIDDIISNQGRYNILENKNNKEEYNKDKELINNIIKKIRDKKIINPFQEQRNEAIKNSNFCMTNEFTYNNSIINKHMNNNLRGNTSNSIY